MDIFQSLWATRLVFILGLVNLVTGLLILLSCRCIPGLKISSKLTGHRAYQRFFRYHCYLWWVFWPSVFIHATFAIGSVGIPL